MPRETRAQAKARTRERLLASAEQLFLEQGYAATAMEEIAQEAGVTKPAIYRHFESKEDLFLALRARGAQLADTAPLHDASLGYEERLARVGRNVARITKDSDPRRLALHLEFRAMSLRRPDARQRVAAEIRSLVNAADSQEPIEPPRLREGVTDGEVLVLGQLLVDGLQEYRAYVPDIITEDTFATALGLLAALVDGGPDGGDGAGRA